MSKTIKPNKEKIKKLILNKDLSAKKLNELFYYSLFDPQSTFESEEGLFPADKLKALQQETINSLKSAFDKKKDQEIHKFLKQPHYEQFEKCIIGTDYLCRILLAKELKNQGIKCKITASDQRTDLTVTGKNINLELKRISSWTNHSSYLIRFCDSVDNKIRHVYMIANPHPPKIEAILDNMTSNSKQLFNQYINEIISGHYVAEHLIRKKNIKLCIRHIDRNGKNGYNVSELCKEVVKKIDEFGV